MKQFTLYVIIICLTVMGTAFVITWMLRTQLQTSEKISAPMTSKTQLLALTAEQQARINALDPRYRDEASALAILLQAERQALADLLESADATEMALLEQVEQVIAAHNALERRVAEYLVAMRRELEPVQQQRLGRYVADEVRQGTGRALSLEQGQGTGMRHGRRQGRDASAEDQGGRGVNQFRQSSGMGTPGSEDAIPDGPGNVRHAINYLFEHHESIERKVEVLHNGVQTTTTTSNPQVVQALQLHVHQMKDRMTSGHPMRRGDPLFRELFNHHRHVEMIIENLPDGVRVTQTSSEPHVVLLIQRHAEVVSEFISMGPDREHQPSALPENYRRH